MRLVLDTNVVVSGSLWDGAPRRLLGAGRVEGAMLYSSPPMLAELTDVLFRPKFKNKIAASQLTAGQLVDLYAELVVLVRPVPIPRLAPDPDDDVVIGTTLAARAHLLVTGDKALWSVAAYECGRIVSVSEALQVVMVG